MNNKLSKCLNCGHEEFYKSNMVYDFVEPDVSPTEIKERHIYMKHFRFNEFINVYCCNECGFLMNFVNID